MKKQKNVTYNQEKNQLTEADKEMAMTMELAEKDAKIIIINVFIMLKDLKKNIMRNRKYKKKSNRTFRDEISEMKLSLGRINTKLDT